MTEANIPPPGFSTQSPSVVITKEALEAQTYTIEQLLSVRDEPFAQEFGKQLPNEINRNLLSGPLRKRRYPFETGNRQRKSVENSGRWNEKSKRWDRNQKSYKGADSESAEPDEMEDVIDPNEPEPEWKDADEDEIKGTDFNFKALNRAQDRELFQETGEVLEEAVVLSQEETDEAQAKVAREIKEEMAKDNQKTLESLFRNNNLGTLPSMPESAVENKTLEESNTSLFASNNLDKPLSHAHQMGPLFGAYERPDRDGREAGLAPGSRSEEPAEEFPPRDADYRDFRAEEPRPPLSAELNPLQASPNGPEAAHEPKGHAQGFPSAERGLSGGPAERGPHPQTNVEKLEQILHEVTSPVRPCANRKYFANARPLTSEELYQYSPKFKEIQDQRKFNGRMMGMKGRYSHQRDYESSQTAAQSRSGSGSRQKAMMRQKYSQQQRNAMLQKYHQASSGGGRMSSRYRRDFPPSREHRGDPRVHKEMSGGDFHFSRDYMRSKEMAGRRMPDPYTSSRGNPVSQERGYPMMGREEGRMDIGGPSSSSHY